MIFKHTDEGPLRLSTGDLIPCGPMLDDEHPLYTSSELGIVIQADAHGKHSQGRQGCYILWAGMIIPAQYLYTRQKPLEETLVLLDTPW